MTITREQAIQILSTRDAHGVLCGYTSGVTEALDMAIEALSRSGDLISRADAIEAWDKLSKRGRTEFDQVLMTLPSADAVSRKECDECKTDKEGVLLQQLAELQGDYETMKNAYEDALAEVEWIPCSERLPDELAVVNITWVNHNPPPYYKYTKDVPLVDSAVYYRGKWYWVNHKTGWHDKVIAWMPLPKPYKESEVEE